MNARINRIEDLLESYLTRGKTENIDDFLRPEIYNISQELKKLKNPENSISYLQSPSQILENNFDGNLSVSDKNEMPFKIDEILDTPDIDIIPENQDIPEPEVYPDNSNFNEIENGGNLFQEL